MKRSEMLDHIIRRVNYHDNGSITPFVTDKLLTELEDLGMLPPRAEFWDTDIYDNPFCNIKNKWEPEEKTKCKDCGCCTGKEKGTSGAARCKECWEARCG